MRKFICIFLSISIFTIFLCPFKASADVIDDLLDFTQDTALNYVKGEIAKYNDFISRRTEAARGYFFWFMLKNSWSCSSSMFDSSRHRFSEDYLRFYYDNLISNTNGGSWYDHGKAYYISEGDIFIQAAGGDVYDLRYTGFRDNVSNDGDNSWLHFDTFLNYYQTYLARVLIGLDVSVTDPNPGKTGLEIAPGYTTGSDLKEAVEQDNNKYYPKNYSGKVSYRTDKYYQNCELYNSYPNYFYMPLIDGNNYFSATGTNEMYLVFFFKNGTDTYYSAYQLHLTYDVIENWYEDRDEIESYSRSIKCEYWDMVNGSQEDLSTFTFDLADYSYVRFNLNNGSLSLYVTSKFSDYINFTGFSNQNPSDRLINSANLLLYCSDLSSSLTLKSCLHCGKPYSIHDPDCQFGGKCDIGYVASATPISTVYNVDTTKIPDDAIITVGGDNIYNYYITNPETGDTSKFGDYITNNYTYITNNNGGQISGSGSVGGNVEVGGKIEVGGSVGVDVNVNVNGNGGGSGVTPNPDDFLGDSEVDLTSYYDKAVEDASGVRQFLGTFFDFLPAELLGLLCLLVAVAICCRIFGR